MILRRVVAGACLASVAALTGAACGTRGEWVYTQPGVTAARQERDEDACTRAAMGAAGVRPTAFGNVIDREAFNRCMTERGYSARYVPR